jgi:hypothetical protein
MKVKTNELTGAALDWAVAKCEGLLGFGYRTDGERFAIEDSDGQVEGFMPSTDWSQGGPIIEREKIGVWLATHYVDKDGVEYGNHWYAEMGCTDENVDSRYCGVADGPTPLIAAMRCYVASKLGDEVEIPEELA